MEYEIVEAYGCRYKVTPGDDPTYYDADTPDRIIDLLERMRRYKCRIAIDYGDPETGLAWEDRPEVGRIGRTTGPVKAPVLVHNRRSMGGPIISSSKIVRIAHSNRRVGIVIYSHPYFRLPGQRPPAPETNLFNQLAPQRDTILHFMSWLRDVKGYHLAQASKVTRGDFYPCFPDLKELSLEFQGIDPEKIKQEATSIEEWQAEKQKGGTND
jgi:hypothetical protein